MYKSSYYKNSRSGKNSIWQQGYQVASLCVGMALGITGAALGITNVVGLSDEKSARQTILDHGYTEPVHIRKASVFTCRDSFYRDVFNAKNKENKNVEIVVCHSILEQRNYIRL